MTDVKLTLPGIIAEKIVQSNLLNSEQKEKLRDYTDLVNTGETGRFEKDVILEKEDLLASKYFNVVATFMNNGKGKHAVKENRH
jgi:peptide subunit release factor 1 (eRF1)